MATEVRRRGHQPVDLSSKDREGDKGRRTFLLPKGHLSALAKYLPAVLLFQVALLLFVILKPSGVQKTPPPPPPPFQEAPDNKPSLAVADVEQLAARVAINNTVIVLVCPTGYTDFLENWLLLMREFRDLHGQFLILVEDQETFMQLRPRFPKNVVWRIEMKDALPNSEACTSQNRITLDALQVAYRKVVYSRQLMNAGQNVLLCDVTAVWLRDAFPFLEQSQNDVLVALGDVPQKGGDQLLLDFPSDETMLLKEPLPRGVGKFPPLDDDFLFFENNVGSWVVVDYWAVVLDAFMAKECNSTEEAAAAAAMLNDTYMTGQSTRAFTSAVQNAIHLSPPPRLGLVPPGKFPPSKVFFEDASWQKLIEKDAVIVRSKSGAKTKDEMRERLKSAGLWKYAG